MRPFQLNGLPLSQKNLLSFVLSCFSSHMVPFQYLWNFLSSVDTHTHGLQLNPLQHRPCFPLLFALFSLPLPSAVFLSCSRSAIYHQMALCPSVMHISPLLSVMKFSPFSLHLNATLIFIIHITSSLFCLWLTYTVIYSSRLCSSLWEFARLRNWPTANEHTSVYIKPVCWSMSSREHWRSSQKKKKALLQGGCWQP